MRLISTAAPACLVIAAVVAFPAALWAGKDCPAATQDCLNSMVSSLQSRGWVGLELRGEESGFVVTRVVDSSPAEAAGFLVGDRLVAVNGVEMATADKVELATVKKEMTPGSKAVYTVRRDGGVREFEVLLAPIPEGVMAEWIGRHMMTEHADAAVASK